MNDCITVVGMDVSKEKIAVAVLPSKMEQITEELMIENHPKAVEKLVKRLASKGLVEFVYEAGPCGYELRRQITEMGHKCAVIAPGLIPVRPGDRVKTDRRDARKLARLYRAGELTDIRVPSREEEAARDLLRIREDILEDRLRAQNRLGKFLLRQGRVHQETKSWGVAHLAWVKAQRFEWEALRQTFQGYVRCWEETNARLQTLDQQVQDLSEREPFRTRALYLKCLKGISTISAMTLLVEVSAFERFSKARQFMSYTGMVASEYSSGNRVVRGSITKVGNAHIRRILVEAAWHYQRKSVLSKVLADRRKGCPETVVGIAKKAEDRLCRKFSRMTGRGKLPQIAAVAVARELSGFAWAIAKHFPTTAA